MASVRSFAFRIATDVSCVLIVAIPLILYKLTATPFQRGFFCDDESIRHPYKKGTVSSFMLYFIGTNTNLLVMIYFEILRTRRLMLSSRTIGRRHIHPVLWELYRVVGIFGFGCCLSQLTTDITKYMVGRLRPHFMAVCRPNEARMAQLCIQNGFPFYVEEDICTGDRGEIREARLSFPSGHSSFSAFTMVYLVLYIQSRWPWRQFKLLKPLIQFGFLMMALSCALSRISDYKHHWSDVLGGLFQGTVVAVLVVFFMSDLFQTSDREATLPIRQATDDINLYLSTAPNGSQSVPVGLSSSGGRKEQLTP